MPILVVDRGCVFGALYIVLRRCLIWDNKEAMNCPVCKKAMLVLGYEGIEVDYCGQCKGLWLDEGEIEQMLDGATAALNLLDWQAGEKGERRCPRCGTKMKAHTLPGSAVEIDACPEACGIWLDRGELQSIAKSSVPEGSAATVLERLTSMFENDVN